MSRHNDGIYMRHMLDHARTAIDIAKDKTQDVLASDPLVKYATLHLMCILGEAANRVSPETQ